MEWVEKLDDGVKRKIRLTFTGKTLMKWQTKRSDEDSWDYDTPPTTEDWDAIEAKADILYHRRRLPYKRVVLLANLRKEAEG